MRKDWGTVELDITGSNHFHDLSQARAIFYAGVDLNIISGLSLYAYGTLTNATDQLFLPKRGASEEETLLRRRQLKTNYSYSSNVGFSTPLDRRMRVL